MRHILQNTNMTSLESDFLTELKIALSKLRRTDSGEEARRQAASAGHPDLQRHYSSNDPPTLLSVRAAGESQVHSPTTLQPSSPSTQVWVIPGGHAENDGVRALPVAPSSPLSAPHSGLLSSPPSAPPLPAQMSGVANVVRSTPDFARRRFPDYRMLKGQVGGIRYGRGLSADVPRYRLHASPGMFPSQAKNNNQISNNSSNKDNCNSNDDHNIENDYRKDSSEGGNRNNENSVESENRNYRNETHNDIQSNNRNNNESNSNSKNNNTVSDSRINHNSRECDKRSNHNSMDIDKGINNSDDSDSDKRNDSTASLGNDNKPFAANEFPVKMLRCESRTELIDVGSRKRVRNGEHETILEDVQPCHHDPLTNCRKCSLRLEMDIISRSSGIEERIESCTTGEAGAKLSLMPQEAGNKCLLPLVVPLTSASFVSEVMSPSWSTETHSQAISDLSPNNSQGLRPVPPPLPPLLTNQRSRIENDHITAKNHLFGELNEVLIRRKAAVESRENLTRIETKPKIGKSVVYLGRGSKGRGDSFGENASVVASEANSGTADDSVFRSDSLCMVAAALTEISAATGSNYDNETWEAGGLELNRCEDFRCSNVCPLNGENSKNPQCRHDKKTEEENQLCDTGEDSEKSLYCRIASSSSKSVKLMSSGNEHEYNQSNGVCNMIFSKASDFAAVVQTNGDGKFSETSAEKSTKKGKTYQSNQAPSATGIVNEADNQFHRIVTIKRQPCQDRRKARTPRHYSWSSPVDLPLLAATGSRDKGVDIMQENRQTGQRERGYCNVKEGGRTGGNPERKPYSQSLNYQRESENEFERDFDDTEAIAAGKLLQVYPASKLSNGDNIHELIEAGKENYIYLQPASKFFQKLAQNRRFTREQEQDGVDLKHQTQIGQLIGEFNAINANDLGFVENERIQLNGDNGDGAYCRPASVVCPTTSVDDSLSQMTGSISLSSCHNLPDDQNDIETGHDHFNKDSSIVSSSSPSSTTGMLLGPSTEQPDRAHGMHDSLSSFQTPSTFCRDSACPISERSTSTTSDYLAPKPLDQLLNDRQMSASLASTDAAFGSAATPMADLEMENMAGSLHRSESDDDSGKLHHKDRGDIDVLSDRINAVTSDVNDFKARVRWTEEEEEEDQSDPAIESLLARDSTTATISASTTSSPPSSASETAKLLSKIADSMPEVTDNRVRNGERRPAAWPLTHKTVSYTARDHEPYRRLVGGVAGVGASVLLGDGGADIISTGFSTYPLVRSPGGRRIPHAVSTTTTADNDIITSLLITHSGEPIPSDGSELGRFGGAGGGSAGGRGSRNHNGRYDLPLSVTVTIPEPTSFHQNGNRICQHLIGSGNSEAPVQNLPLSQLRSYGPSSLNRNCGENRMVFGGDRRDQISHPGFKMCDNHINNNNAEKNMVSFEERAKESATEGLEDPSKGQNVPSAGKPCVLPSAWPALEDGDRAAAGGKGRLVGVNVPIGPGPRTGAGTEGGIGTGVGTGGVVGVYSAGEESDLSSGSFARDAHSFGKNWRLSSPNSYSIFRPDGVGGGGRPLLMTAEEDGRGDYIDAAGRCRRRTGKKGAGEDGFNEAVHSSDADVESLYQDDRCCKTAEDHYAQSLIQYVKSQELAEITENIKNLYRYQIDAALSRSPTSSVLDQLACCFICNYSTSPSYDKTGNSNGGGGGGGGGRSSSHHGDSSTGSAEKSNLPTIGISDYFAPVTAYGSGLLKGVVNQTSFFFVDTKSSRGSLTIQIQGPTGAVKCFAESDLDGTTHRISYTPLEVGIHSTTISWNEHQLHGSPFRPKIIDPGRVVAVGGWSKLLDSRGRIPLQVDVLKRIDFNAKHAGPGQLSAVLIGPDGDDVTTDVYAPSKNKYAVTFIPRQEGEHQLKVLWSDLAITCCPLVGIATRGQQNDLDTETLLPSDYSLSSSSPSCRTPWPTGPSPERVVLLGALGLRELRVAEPVRLIIDGSAADPGDPTVRLIGVRNEEEVVCESIGENKYSCVCAPKTPGAYLLCVLWSGYHIPGSPYKLTALSGSDPSKVVCAGVGLKHGIVGQDLEIQICTDGAGPGDLSAICTGPNNLVPCKLIGRGASSFTLVTRPQESGRHVIQVKYDNVHVPGSPFTVKVSSGPDAGQVSVSGPGIHNGLLDQFSSVFTVETSGAGSGQLTVKVRGPKGSFHVEMDRATDKDRTIRCRYNPTESGVYALEVKWSGKNVPGSPFNVHIVNTLAELERLESSCNSSS